MLLRYCLTRICGTKNHIGPTVFSALHNRCYSIKVAIVGSGPAGFYTTQKLLKNPEIKVDIYEKLPVPFGLVRYGVAPDHADVKNVINSFTNVANNDRVDFYGNVGLGEQLTLEDLADAYHVVVLCYGSSMDKLLNIEGEASKNTISARNFVGWYNGVPDDKDLDPQLDCDTACIIGQGNVALDCARILLRPTSLDKTDISSHAQKVLSQSKIKKIYIIGRRGPVQVSFTIKELRELIRMNEGKTRIEPASIFDDVGLKLENTSTLSRQRRRITELLINLSFKGTSNMVTEEGIELVFKFLSKPQRIIPDKTTGRVMQLELKKTLFNTPEEFVDERAHPVETDDIETLNCGLVIRSIGYKAQMLDKSLPVDYKHGAILNTNGRIQGHSNLYCSGWLATGATGVIAGTLNSSQITAQTILQDISANNLPNLTRQKLGHKIIAEILRRKKVQIVHFNDWLRIDELERRLGEIQGKPREKLTDVTRMLEVARGKNLNE